MAAVANDFAVAPGCQLLGMSGVVVSLNRGFAIHCAKVLVFSMRAFANLDASLHTCNKTQARWAHMCS